MSKLEIGSRVSRLIGARLWEGTITARRPDGRFTVELSGEREGLRNYEAAFLDDWKVEPPAKKSEGFQIASALGRLVEANGIRVG